VTIMPESGEKVFYHWLENIEPWCISRQLWWGHQIPVWYVLDVKEIYDAFPGNEENDETDAPTYFKYHELEETTLRNAPLKAFCAASFDDVQAMVRDWLSDRPLCKDWKVEEVSDGVEAMASLTRSISKEQNILPIYRDPDVLDTWFSSGLWPFGTGWPEQTPELDKYFPGDVLVTGQDILFFWVARMMMMAQAVEGENPFHTVYLHQLVRDEAC